MTMRREWTKAEIARLKKLFGTKPAKELVADFDRPLSGIIGKAYGLGLQSSLVHKWTEADDALLKAKNGKVSNDELAAEIGTTLCGLRNRRARFGLSSLRTQHKRWLLVPKGTLERLHDEGKTKQEIAKILGFDNTFIGKKAKELGIPWKIRVWTEEKRRFVADHYGIDKSVQDIADELGVVFTAVYAEAYRQRRDANAK